MVDPRAAITSRRAATLGLLASLLIAGCQPKSAAPTNQGEPAPEFATEDLRGDPVALAELQGKVVLLNVWATWCEPCVAELPELARLHRELGDRGFTVIGLNADVMRKRGAVLAMVEQHDLPYPIWMDPLSKGQVAFKLRGYPTSMLIDRQGRIRWKREGVIVPNDPELTQQLELLLNE